MSAFGPTSSCLPGDLTDEAYKGDLVELGWKGQYAYDDPEVVALRVSLPVASDSRYVSLVPPLAVTGWAFHVTDGGGCRRLWRRMQGSQTWS